MARTMQSTTLAGSIGPSDVSLGLASTTGITSGVTILYIDREAMLVLANPVNNRISRVFRGVQGTAATGHASGTTVYYGPPESFAVVDPSGTIAPEQNIYLPRVVIPTGNVWQDNGSGVWERVGGGGGGTLFGPQGSATLNFGAIGDGQIAELTFTVSGALVGDKVAPSWPDALDAGLTGSMFVSAADTITVRLANLSGGSINPAALSYGAQIVRS